MSKENLDSLVVSRIEHEHRYQCASRLARGSILDIACGIGYGAEILLSNSAANSYVGVDMAPDAIRQAKLFSVGRDFVQASADNLPFPEATFDTIVTLETLEHLSNPAAAVSEFARVMRPQGMLIGSVPTAAFEAFCTAHYGQNPAHLHSFTSESIRLLLTTSFKYCELFISKVGVSVSLYQERNTPSPSRVQSILEANEDGAQYGSYFFVASNSPLPMDLFEKTCVSKMGGSYFQIEQLQIDRLMSTTFLDDRFSKIISEKDNLVLSKEKLVKESEQLVILKDKEIADLRSQIDHLTREMDQLRLLQKAPITLGTQLSRFLKRFSPGN